MYPVLFRIRDFEVTSFGVMVAIAALVGLWLLRRELQHSGSAPPTTVPVHPTQLYEAVGLGLLGWCLLRWRRRGVSNAIVLGRYPVIAGAFRFAIEFIRVSFRFTEA